MPKSKTKIKNNIRSRRHGAFLPIILAISGLLLAYAVLIVTLSISNMKSATLQNKRITSMSLAEAGIDYYMWHLTHNDTDYCDDQACKCLDQSLTTCSDGPYGPYSHDYKDQNGKVVGTYSLVISPPTASDSSVTVKSIGKVSGKSPTRTVSAKLGMRSISDYALVCSNNEGYIARGEVIDGSIFMNLAGAKIDGEVTGYAYSTLSKAPNGYSNGFFPGIHDGIWLGPNGKVGTKVSQNPSLTQNQMESYIKLGVQAIDMEKILVDINKMRDQAKDQGRGHYYDGSVFGWHIVLKADTYDLYQVKNMDSFYNITTTGANKEVLTSEHTNIPYPSSGLIFFDSAVWVNSQVDTDGNVNSPIGNHPITIVQGTSNKNMYIPSSIKYAQRDAQTRIGLVSATTYTSPSSAGIVVLRDAPNVMEIDASMIAPYGWIYLPEYANIIKESITVYGSMAHRLPGGTRWGYYNAGTGNITSGYRNATLTEDPYSKDNNPPFFPKISGYMILNWKEE